MTNILYVGKLFAKRYKLIEHIGTGGFSVVWKAADMTIGEKFIVAVKIYTSENGLEENGLDVFSKEFCIAIKLKHPNLLCPTHYDIYEGSPYLVLSYCSKGSVFQHVGNISEKELAKFIYQVASALNYLHQQEPPIIHQDIKPENILINDNGDYLLSDFGVCIEFQDSVSRKTALKDPMAGARPYMPPERFSSNHIPVKANDIFSFGVTLYELATGSLPFGEHGGILIFSGSKLPDLPNTFSRKLNQLVSSCLAKETYDRPTASQISDLAIGFIETNKWNLKLISKRSQGKKWRNFLVAFAIIVSVFTLMFLLWSTLDITQHFQVRSPGIYLNQDALPGEKLKDLMLTSIPLTEGNMEEKIPYSIEDVIDFCLYSDTIKSFPKGTRIEWHHLFRCSGLYLKNDYYSGTLLQKEMVEEVPVLQGSNTTGRPVCFEDEIEHKGYRLVCSEKKEIMPKGTLITWNNIEKIGGIYLTKDVVGGSKLREDMLLLLKDTSVCAVDYTIIPNEIDMVLNANLTGSKTDTINRGTLLRWNQLIYNY